MDLDVERLNLHFNGNVSTARAGTLAGMTAARLASALTPHAERLARASGDSYSLPALRVPPVHVPEDATDTEIADMAATVLARALLRGLEVA